MSDRLERVLNALDAGDQSSAETSYGTDLDPTRCARCQHHDPAPQGDLCGGCRTFLLGDTDDDPRADPAQRAATTTAAFNEPARQLSEAIGVSMQEAIDTIRQLVAHTRLEEAGWTFPTAPATEDHPT